MKNPTMLFREGSEHEIWGLKLDTITVDSDEVDEYIGNGWFKHPHDVKSEPEEDKPRRGRPPKAKE